MGKSKKKSKPKLDKTKSKTSAKEKNSEPDHGILKASHLNLEVKENKTATDESSKRLPSVYSDDNAASKLGSQAKFTATPHRKDVTNGGKFDFDGKKKNFEHSTLEEVQNECEEVILELERLEWRPDMAKIIKNHLDVSNIFENEYADYLKLAESVQKEIDRLEDEKLELIHESDVLFRQAMRERLLEKSLDRRRRHQHLLEDPGEATLLHIKRMGHEWHQIFIDNIRFFIQNWIQQDHEGKTLLELLDKEFRELQEEFYQAKGIICSTERTVQEADADFREIVKGYRLQLCTQHKKVIEVIQGYRSRHYYYLESLERRESERHVRYQCLRELRDIAYNATYKLHGQYSNYSRNALSQLNKQAERLKNVISQDQGVGEFDEDLQRLVSQLSMFNPRRLVRLHHELAQMLDTLRTRLHRGLMEIAPLNEHRQIQRKRRLEDKLAKNIGLPRVSENEVRSMSSDFKMRSINVDDLSNITERERYFIDGIGASFEMESYADSLRHWWNTAWAEYHLDNWTT